MFMLIIFKDAFLSDFLMYTYLKKFDWNNLIHISILIYFCVFEVSLSKNHIDNWHNLANKKL